MATDLRLPTERIVRPDKDRFLHEENPFEAMMTRFSTLFAVATFFMRFATTASTVTSASVSCQTS